MLDDDANNLLQPILPFDERVPRQAMPSDQQAFIVSASARLRQLSHLCKGLSGRTLRRLPVLAHARHIGLAQTPIDLNLWLDGMWKALHETLHDLQKTRLGSSESESAI